MPVTYATAHARVSRRRGKASTHPCARCGGQARQWAYTGTDAAELVEVRPDVAGRQRPMRYSLDTSMYTPLCVPCHFARDTRRPRSTDPNSLPFVFIRTRGGVPVEIIRTGADGKLDREAVAQSDTG